ncbi:MAG: hypothetical protein PUB15_05870 [Ruminobacter sp.]|nr:hypothetical protein [Ruminobacter sp.]
MSTNSSSVYQENFTQLIIRFVILLVSLIGIFFLINLTKDLTIKTIIATFSTIIFLFIPRLFYARYLRVITNEEAKIEFMPKGFWERFIFATRDTLASPFIVVVAAIMTYFALITKHTDGLIIIALSVVLFIALECSLNLPKVAALFAVSKIPSVFPFYRRWIAILITGLISFIISFVFFEPSFTKDEAFKLLASEVTSRKESSTYAISIFVQALNITQALSNYLIGLTQDNIWYYALKFLFIALPYTILSINITLGISLITLSRYRIKEVISKQEWVIKRQNFFMRHWKNILLPIFLVSLFVGAYHFGKPYYDKYVAVAINKPENTKVANAEIIGQKFYRLDTIKKVNNAKDNALANIASIYNEAINETHLTANELNELSDSFSNWYLNLQSGRQFTHEDNIIKQGLYGSLKIKDSNLRMQSLTTDSVNSINNVLQDLTISIETIIHDGFIADVNPDNSKNINQETKEPIVANLKVDENLIKTLKLQDKTEIDFTKSLSVTALPNSLEYYIFKDLKDNSSIWYRQTQLDENKSLEDELLGEVSQGETSDNSSNKLLTKDDLYNYLKAQIQAWESDTNVFFTKTLHQKLGEASDEIADEKLETKANKELEVSDDDLEIIDEELKK